MMGMFRSMAGMVTAELTSADVEWCLHRINEQGIKLYDVSQAGDLTVRLTVQRQDYRDLLKFAKARGLTLKLMKRQGIYWGIKGMTRRPVLLVTMLLMLFLMLWAPTRIFFLRVEGNAAVPSRYILEKAAEAGIGFGTSRREARSERMKNALLEAIPELQWAGVNTYGCVGVISVRERAAPEEGGVSYGAGSIVAHRDGVVLSCTVIRGTASCLPGQAVKRGQVLISGFTDCGIAILGKMAEGEVFARTRHDLVVKTPSQTLLRGLETTRETKYSLLFGKKRINFYKGSGISDATCVKMYSEYCLTLPGGFRLPIMLVKETVVGWNCESAELDPDEVSGRLCGFAGDYLKNQMIAGTILSREESVTLLEGAYSLIGEYASTEMIGRVRPEQIGALHETD